MELQEIEQQFQRLSSAEQETLLLRLQLLVDDSKGELPTATQRAELERRLRVLDEGESKTYSLEDSLNYVDKRLKP